MNITNLLIILPAFLVTIGILVTVHEFGHFWVARKLGVKVLRFSIGFGKPLWQRTSSKDETEYVIAALPLGGYVKMLDEREGEVPENELGQAFNRQAVWKRIAIVAAGPIANFLLAIALYAAIFMTGNPALYPFVTAQPETPAAEAGFQAGDKITAINGHEVASWEEARMRLLEDYLKSGRLTVQVQTQEGRQATRQLDLSEKALLKDEGDFLDKSGLRPWAPEYEIVLGEIRAGSAAEKAGLQTGDHVLALDGERPKDAQAMVDYIQARPEQSIAVRVQRASGVTTLQVTPEIKTVSGQEVGQIGAGLGMRVPEAIRSELQFTQYFGPFTALARGADKTWQMSVVTVKLMGRMLVGQVSLKNISGPITIARYSGETAVAGLPYYLGFLAIVSLSLGILNLLPIPMLDGGHLLYYFIEIIKGSPVSARVEEFGLRFGMAVVAGIMVLAFYNDFMRLLN